MQSAEICSRVLDVTAARQDREGLLAAVPCEGTDARHTVSREITQDRGEVLDSNALLLVRREQQVDGSVLTGDAEGHRAGHFLEADGVELTRESILRYS